MPARRAVAVGLIVLAATLLTGRGALGGGPDEEVVFAQAVSLLRDRDLRFDAAELAPIARHTDAVREGPPGTFTAVYGPLQAVLTVPLLAAGRLVSGDGRAALVAWACALNPLLTALTAALLTLWLAELGTGPRAAVAGGLLYALATTAWPYAKTFLSEPLSAVCLLAAARWGYLAGRGDGPAPRGSGAAGRAAVPPLGLAGLALAAALLTRPHNFVLVAPLAALAWRRGQPGRLALLLTPPALACGWWLWANVARFGSLLDFGYLPEIQTSFRLSAVPAGLVGQLLSPGRGLLWYAPPVVMALWGWRSLRATEPRLATCLLVAVLVQWLFYSLRPTWWGNWCWGPRYLVPVLPLLMVLAGAGFAAAPRWLAILLATAGILGALAGLLVYNGLYQDWLFAQPDGLWRLLWQPLDSPLVGHWRFALAEGGRYLDLFALQLGRAGGAGLAMLYAAPRLILLLAGLWLLARDAGLGAWYKPGDRDAAAEPPR